MERQRTTAKLLATQGYVIGVEISGSGSRQSVALADLDGNILYRVRHPLEYVPDTETVLRLLDDMLAEVMAPERLNDGRILRVGVAVGGLVDASLGVVRTLHHAHGWYNFPLQDYLTKRLDVPCIIDNNANAAALAEVQSGAASPTALDGGARRAERIVLYVGLGPRDWEWSGGEWQDLSWRDVYCWRNRTHAGQRKWTKMFLWRLWPPRGYCICSCNFRCDDRTLCKIS